MLESFNNIQKFQYKKLSPEEQKARGILGRLEGIIADGKNPTRNGRKYPMQLWEKVFADPIMQEKIANKVCLGELGHPEDRSETDITKAALCLAETPKKGPDGNLYGVFDIIDTPCGKILKTLCDYGCNIGISSRGQGDVYTDYDGQETVDEDTYTCECFDAVLLPAVKSARLNYVNESLGNKTLYESLNEAIEAASSDDEKIIMTNSLERVGIDYKNKGEAQVGTSDVSATDDAAANDGADLVKDLQEALKANAELSKQITKLQEKLSVCYAKEVRNDAAVTKLKNAVVALSEDARKYKAVSSQIVSMKEQLDEKATQFVKQNKVIESFRRRSEQTSETIQQLTESCDTKDVRIKTLVRRNNQLQEQLKRDKSEHEKVVSSLQEELEGSRTDAKVIKSQCEKKLASANKLIEQYRKESDTAKKLYVESKAKQLGVDVDDVTNRLTENYTFEDVNKVCENLRDYKLNMSKLPFNIDLRKGARVTVNESKDVSQVINPDDILDDSITNLLSNIQ